MKYACRVITCASWWCLTSGVYSIIPPHVRASISVSFICASNHAKKKHEKTTKYNIIRTSAGLCGTGGKKKSFFIAYLFCVYVCVCAQQVWVWQLYAATICESVCVCLFAFVGANLATLGPDPRNGMLACTNLLCKRDRRRCFAKARRQRSGLCLDEWQADWAPTPRPAHAHLMDVHIRALVSQCHLEHNQFGCTHTPHPCTLTFSRYIQYYVCIYCWFTNKMRTRNQSLLEFPAQHGAPWWRSGDMNNICFWFTVSHSVGGDAVGDGVGLSLCRCVGVSQSAVRTQTGVKICWRHPAQGDESNSIRKYRHAHTDSHIEEHTTPATPPLSTPTASHERICRFIRLWCSAFSWGICVFVCLCCFRDRSARARAHDQRAY